MGKQNYPDSEKPLPLRTLVCTKLPFKNHLETKISLLDKTQRENWASEHTNFMYFSMFAILCAKHLSMSPNFHLGFKLL